MCLSKSGPGTLSGEKKKRKKVNKGKKAEQLWVMDKGNSNLMNQSWEPNTIKTTALTNCALKEALMSSVSMDYYGMKCAF